MDNCASCQKTPALLAQRWACNKPLTAKPIQVAPNNRSATKNRVLPKLLTFPLKMPDTNQTAATTSAKVSTAKIAAETRSDQGVCGFSGVEFVVSDINPHFGYCQTWVAVKTYKKLEVAAALLA